MSGIEAAAGRFATARGFAAGRLQIEAARFAIMGIYESAMPPNQKPLSLEMLQVNRLICGQWSCPRNICG